MNQRRKPGGRVGGRKKGGEECMRIDRKIRTRTVKEAAGKQLGDWRKVAGEDQSQVTKVLECHGGDHCTLKDFKVRHTIKSEFVDTPSSS